VEPGTNPGHLFQQNTMRDAMVAALSLNIFHKYTERVKMTNIAQVANVLQSMVLTKGDKMVLTPTYHVFRMYNVHQDAQFIPFECDSEIRKDALGRPYPVIDATASRNAAGEINVVLVNTDLEKDSEVVLDFDSMGKAEISGEILTSGKIQDYNDFDSPEKVCPKAFKDFKAKDGKVTVKLPAKSIVSLKFN
jgi:alpha-N-arabinofuranosidase